MRIKEITNYLETIAPLHYQEDYDKSTATTGMKFKIGSYYSSIKV